MKKFCERLPRDVANLNRDRRFDALVIHRQRRSLPLAARIVSPIPESADAAYRAFLSGIGESLLSAACRRIVLHNRNDERRGVSHIVEDAIVGGHGSARSSAGLAKIQIAIEARKITTADLKAQPVSR